MCLYKFCVSNLESLTRLKEHTDDTKTKQFVERILNKLSRQAA
jgi:hypothetical protein